MGLEKPLPGAQGTRTIKKSGRAKPLKLSWDEIGFLAEGLSFSSRPFKAVIKGLTEEYGLGPRGAWILMLIGSRQVVYPLDLTNFFRIGRSLITAELTRLTNGRLITYRKRTDDRRRVELDLTPLGEKVMRLVREELSKLVTERFSSWSREEVLLCARMLHEFIFAEPVLFAKKSDAPPPAIPRRRSPANPSPRRARRAS